MFDCCCLPTVGRFSEKSHEVFDKYTEDKSKFSEAEAQLAAVRRGKEELEEKNAILVKYQLESLSVHTQEEIEDIKMNLTIKTVECDDLKKTVSSLRKELKSAEDLLASKLDVASQFEATESERDVSGLSVSQSLGAEFMGRNLSYNNTTQQPTGQAMWRQHSDTTGRM